MLTFVFNNMFFSICLHKIKKFIKHVFQNFDIFEVHFPQKCTRIYICYDPIISCVIIIWCFFQRNLSVAIFGLTGNGISLSFNDSIWETTKWAVTANSYHNLFRTAPRLLIIYYSEYKTDKFAFVHTTVLSADQIITWIYYLQNLLRRYAFHQFSKIPPSPARLLEDHSKCSFE